jgi:hypothetical protein
MHKKEASRVQVPAQFFCKLVAFAGADGLSSNHPSDRCSEWNCAMDLEAAFHAHLKSLKKDGYNGKCLLLKRPMYSEAVFRECTKMRLPVAELHLVFSVKHVNSKFEYIMHKATVESYSTPTASNFYRRNHVCTYSPHVQHKHANLPHEEGIDTSVDYCRKVLASGPGAEVTAAIQTILTESLRLVPASTLQHTTATL